MPVHSIEELIQRQVRQWHLHRELQRTVGEDAPPRPRPVITISRELGAGARGLARDLARRLDLQIHGVSLIDRIARDKDIERRFVDALDERSTSQIDLWVKGILNRRLFTRDAYLAALVRAVRMLAVDGGVVIIGRGANIILDGDCDLRLRVVASPGARIERVMSYEGVDRDEAQRMIEESDAARAGFLCEHFRVEVDDPRRYDLVLNTDRLRRERLAEMAMTALEVRGAFASS